MPKRTRPHRSWLLEQLSDSNIAAEYLNEARKDSRSIFLKALRNVAEAHRMAVVAENAGVNRESLYKALSEEGNPSLQTYDSVLDALGLEYEFKPKQVSPIAPTPSTSPILTEAKSGSPSMETVVAETSGKIETTGASSSGPTFVFETGWSVTVSVSTFCTPTPTMARDPFVPPYLLPSQADIAAGDQYAE